MIAGCDVKLNRSIMCGRYRCSWDIKINYRHGKKLGYMEKQKRYTFNIDKTNYMIITNGREVVQTPEIVLKRGEIKRIDKYKHLGNWIGEK